MASSTTTANPDMPVQIKITVTGKEETRKFKLTLKDLGANVLPEKVSLLLRVVYIGLHFRIFAAPKLALFTR